MEHSARTATPLSSVNSCGEKKHIPQKFAVSVIVPCCNEVDVIEQFHMRLTTVLNQLPTRSEIIYINDGSTDATWQSLLKLPPSTSEQVLICLSRNFGKEAAMSAGLEASRGAAVVVIDSDLQDPPELIPKMLTVWQGGYDIVNMRRRKRYGESWLKKLSAALYYRLLNRLSDIYIPENVGDFRLLSRRVVDHINALPEKTRYMKGLFAWPGFEQKELLFDRDPRMAGSSKWHYLKLIGLAFEGLTSFSTHPLRLAIWLGMAISLLSMVYAAVIVVRTLLFDIPVADYAFLMTTVLFLGGIQLVVMGFLGEYVDRIFVESKQRPSYLTSQTTIKPATGHPPENPERDADKQDSNTVFK